MNKECAIKKDSYFVSLCDKY